MTDHWVVRAWAKDAASRLSAKCAALGSAWSRTANYLTCAAAVILVAVAILSAIGVERRDLLAPEQISASNGFMYHAELKAGPVIAPRPDTNDDPQNSGLVIFEEGRPLGSPHSLHAEIAAKGSGRYSHWGGQSWANQSIFFSASDGSDPRTNGRTYTVEYRTYPSPIALALSIVLFFASIVAAMLYSGHPRSFLESIARTGSGALRTRAFRWGLSIASVLLLTPVFLSKDLAVSTADAVRSGSMNLAAILFGLIAVRFVQIEISAKRIAVIRAIAVSAILFLLGTQVSGPSVLPLFIGALLGVLLSLTVAREQFSELISIEEWVSGFGTIRNIFLICCGATLINTLPEIIEYWNESGWYDSVSYSNIARAIALGEKPYGDSYFMPIYQYGMALFFWIFGHDFRVQQLINILMSLATVCLMVHTAFILFRSRLLAALIGLVVSFQPKLHHAVWYTQIENWYIPVVALSLWFVALYVDRPNLWRSILVGLGAAFVLNMRLQGAFYAVALGLVVLVPNDMRIRERVRQGAVFAMIFVVVGVFPWSLRNYVVEGRFALSSEQSAQGLAITNDPRIGFYGLRYLDNYGEIFVEWETRFPDQVERSKAQRAYFHERLLTDPMWFVEAFRWRALAFFGLAPWTVWAPDGPIPFDWNNNWKSYIKSVHYFLPLLLASTLGLALSITSRYGIFLTVLIGSNVFVAFLAGFGEPRLSYPVMLLEILLSIAMFYRPTTFDKIACDPIVTAITSRHNIGSAIFVLAAFTTVGTFVHWQYGRAQLYRPLEAGYRNVNPEIHIDESLPVLAWSGTNFVASGRQIDSLDVGRRYRAYVAVSSNMYPPRYTGIITGLPAFATDPRTPPFFLSTLMTPIPFDEAGKQPPWATNQVNRIAIPARFSGVEGSTQINEGMYLEAELEVVGRGTLSHTGYWFDILKYRTVPRPPKPTQ